MPSKPMSGVRRRSFHAPSFNLRALSRGGTNLVDSWNPREAAEAPPFVYAIHDSRRNATETEHSMLTLVVSLRVVCELIARAVFSRNQDKKLQKFIENRIYVNANRTRFAFWLGYRHNPTGGTQI